MVTKAEAVATNQTTFDAVCAACTMNETCNVERQERQRQRCTDALGYLEAGGPVKVVGFHRITDAETIIACAYTGEQAHQSVAWEDGSSCPTVIWYAAVKEAEMMGVPLVEMVDGERVRLAVVEDERRMR